tara:strand:+ start:948 stop:1202 length:255 start_codon:yes stop_codon:yes gene_type:complete
MKKTENEIGTLGTELESLDEDKDRERIEEIERTMKFDEDSIEYCLTKDKRKPHSFKVVRSHRQKVRVREMLDSLNEVSDSEDDE